jgi:hypothetical protein
MDWGGFLPDVVSGTVGAFVGVVLALLFDHWRGARGVRRSDLQLLQALVDRLAGKRALSLARSLDAPFDAKDLERCNLSVLDARDRVARVSEDLEALKDVRVELQGMEVDCMSYLNYAELHPARSVEALLALSRRLAAAEVAMQAKVHELSLSSPGSRDSVADRSWLPG